MGAATIRTLGAPGDLGWVVKAHGEQYAAEFGWDMTFEALVARIVADYTVDHDAGHEAAWIAEVNGKRVGCVFCVRKDEQTAQLRILLVTSDGRGYGLGGRLVDAAVDFACAAGYRQMVLWTNAPLVAALGSTSTAASGSSTRSATTASASISSARTMLSILERAVDEGSGPRNPHPPNPLSNPTGIGPS
jgi:GNAT superfamily N-acetyltransferase